MVTEGAEEYLDKHFAMKESEEDDAEVDMQVYINQ